MKFWNRLSPGTRRLLFKVGLGIVLVWLVLQLLGFLISRIVVMNALLSLLSYDRMGGVNILAFGIDDTKDIQRSDTIMVFRMDLTHNRLGVLSIPRDTRVSVPDVGLTKVNHAFARGGAPLLQKTVAEFLNIPIDYYIQADLNGVAQLIDEMGGVTLKVDTEYVYADRAGNYRIDLKKGYHHMTGQEAVEFLRYRADGLGDIGRIRRQQQLMEALTRQLFTASGVLRIPFLLTKFQSHFKTNMSSEQTVGFSNSLLGIFKNGRIEITTVPGEGTLIGGVSYWRPDTLALARTVDNALFGLNNQAPELATVETQDRRSSAEEKRRYLTYKEMQVLEAPASVATAELKVAGQSLVIEVLNGNGTPGQARRTADLIRAKGFKILRVGNAASHGYQKTLLVDWKGKIEPVVQLAQVLGVDADRIIVYNKPTKQLDATLVLGADWSESQIGGSPR
ncbi:MAG: LCP family protein [Candidatus Margulisiibacteriota bacterium]